ncbi:MAG: ECF transporter S component [Clostridia bacterium]|nr:ECF transporter S component [Clostridia bacterium]
MNQVSSKKIVLNGLMIALVFVVTRFSTISTPVGYFNLGDVAIMIAAVLLGGKSGFAAGSIGSALADLSAGYGIFAPVTFVIKGLEGYIVGRIAHSEGENRRSEVYRIAAVIAGSIIMIAGYFIGEAYILSLFDNTFGLAAAIKDLTTTNIPQGSISAVVGYLIIAALEKANIRKYVLS